MTDEVEVPSLRILHISGNNIGNVDVHTWTERLITATSLQAMNIPWDSLRGPFHSTRLQVLTCDTSLCSLDLDMTANIRVSTTGSGHEAFIKLLLCNTSLRSLQLNDTVVSKHFAIELGEELKGNCTLRQLDMSHTTLCQDSLLPIANAIRSNSSIRHLNISGNTSCLGEHGSRALAEALRLNTSLQILDLSFCDLFPQNATIIVEALSMNKALQSINLSNNHIATKPFAEMLSMLISNNPSLRCINIHSNLVGDDGAQAIASALMQSNLLEEVNLSSNGVREAGFCALAEALHHNTSLKSLNLSWNHGGFKGFAALGRALRCNRALRFLEIFEPTQAGGGIVEILRTLAECPRRPSLAFYACGEVMGVVKSLGLPDPPFWQISDLVRYVCDLHVNKLIAFAMGQHARLGMGSYVRELREDAVQMIFDAFFGIPGGNRE